MAFCSKCGNKLEDGAKFCPKCGASTSQEGNVAPNDEKYRQIVEEQGKLVAVKTYKEETNCDLLDAKDYIDNLVGEEPTKGKKSRSGCLKWGVGIFFGIVLLGAIFGNDDEKKQKTEQVAETEDVATSNSGKEEHEAVEQEEKVEAEKQAEVSEEFFEKGHTYKSTTQYADGVGCKIHYVYELTLYHDGSIELTKFITYPNHEYDDTTQTFECKMEKKTESKRDVQKQWYEIKGKSGNEVTTLLVSMEGKVYGFFGKNDYEAVGSSDCYCCTFTREK